MKVLVLFALIMTAVFCQVGENQGNALSNTKCALAVAAAVAALPLGGVVGVAQAAVGQGSIQDAGMMAIMGPIYCIKQGCDPQIGGLLFSSNESQNNQRSGAKRLMMNVGQNGESAVPKLGKRWAKDCEVAEAFCRLKSHTEEAFDACMEQDCPNWK